MSLQPAYDFVRTLNALGSWRAQIAIIVLVFAAFWLAIAVVFGLVPVGPGLTNRLGGVAGGDFMFFYPVSTLAADGRAADVYDPLLLTNEAGRHFGPKIPELVWPYPPTILLPFSVLGRLSPESALVAWVATSALALLGLGRLLLGRWRFGLLPFFFPASALALFTGQTSPILALLLGIALSCPTRAPGLAGAALGLFVCKPQLGLTSGLFALFDHRWRVLIAAFAVGAAVTGASLVVFGPGVWATFWEAGLRHAGHLGVEVPARRLVTVFGTVYTATGSARLALLLHIPAAALFGAIGFRLWRQGTLRSIQMLGAACATLQITPYAFDYDLVVLLIPWLLMIRESSEDGSVGRPLFWLWIGLTCVAPASYMTSIYTGYATASLLLAVITIGTWATSRRIIPTVRET